MDEQPEKGKDKDGSEGLKNLEECSADRALDGTSCWKYAVQRATDSFRCDPARKLCRAPQRQNSPSQWRSLFVSRTRGLEESNHGDRPLHIDSNRNRCHLKKIHRNLQREGMLERQTMPHRYLKKFNRFPFCEFCICVTGIVVGIETRIDFAIGSATGSRVHHAFRSASRDHHLHHSEVDRNRAGTRIAGTRYRRR